MSNLVNLDVLVVYSTDLATSASVGDAQSKHPFSLDSKQANYNLSYAYFLDACEKRGMKAGFTTSADVVGAGECRNYWTFLSDVWTKVESGAKSQHIFDKISPSSPSRVAERQLLLSDARVVPFNDPELFTLFFDKLLTYKKLAGFAIPTVGLRTHQPADITAALKKLRVLISNHPHSQDFSTQLVLKDRFGAGGNYVYKISRMHEKRIATIMAQNPTVTFVLQPFLAFDQGYSYKDRQTATDIRLIFQFNKLLQPYIRMAKTNDFRCNEHQGGQLLYVKETDIPKSVQIMAQKIIKKINKPRSLFALDFVISNTGHPYFLEGNIGPGIDWDVSKKYNEKMSKQLIHNIVDEFASRIKH